MKKSITAIVPLLGDYLQVQPHLPQLLSGLAEAYAIETLRLEVIFVADGEHWSQTADFSAIPQNKSFKFLTAHCNSMPSHLFNIAACEANGEFLAFIWPGVDSRAWARALRNLADGIDESVDLLAGPSALHANGQRLESWLWHCPSVRPDSYPPGWIELADIVPMNSCLVRREMFERIGGFSSSPLLQRGFWWDFTLRASRESPFSCRSLGVPSSVWTWYSYPLTCDVGVSGDIMARRIMRGQNSEVIRSNQSIDWDDVSEFSQSLSPSDSARLFSQLQRFALSSGIVKRAGDITFSREASEDLPLRVTVLGGPNEPAHNQLCFFNYFSILEKSSKITWRTILDTAATQADLLKSDLVFFSRVKSEEGCRLMDFCVANSIPTIYMLDDNWFVVGKEWPEYAALFSPGAEMYENFLHCLRNADSVLTYNKILAEDIAPYAKRVTLLPTNIDLSLFNPANRNGRQKTMVGYVGTARQATTAFAALREVAEMRDDIELFVMTTVVPREFVGLPKEKVKIEPYVFGYRRYASLLSNRVPDILIAPLGSTRTEASKCPNKYLEISAIGAVGIYSDVEPYRSFVKPYETGLLVEESKDAWVAAIEELVDDRPLRSRLAKRAMEDVREHFSTTVVLDEFYGLLLEAVRR